MATVDAKLSEMQRLKSEIDLLIEEKVREKVRFEAKKFESVIESQRALFGSRLEAHLEQKAEEVKKVVEARASQLGDIHERVQDELAKIQSEKKIGTELLNEINDKLESLDAVREQLVADTNAAVAHGQSSFREFMADSERQRAEIEARTSQAIQLESKVTEGMIEDVKQRIESLKLEKEQELTARVEGTIRHIEEMAAEVDVRGISELIA